MAKNKNNSNISVPSFDSLAEFPQWQTKDNVVFMKDMSSFHLQKAYHSAARRIEKNASFMKQKDKAIHSNEACLKQATLLLEENAITKEEHENFAKVISIINADIEAKKNSHNFNIETLKQKQLELISEGEKRAFDVTSPLPSYEVED